MQADDLSDVAEHPAHVAPAISLTQAAPRGRRHIIALGGNDCATTLWDVRSMAVVRPLPISNKPVRRVDLSADGSMLAMAGTFEPKPNAGDFDCVDLLLLDHEDLYGGCRLHRCAPRHHAPVIPPQPCPPSSQNGSCSLRAGPCCVLRQAAVRWRGSASLGKELTCRRSQHGRGQVACLRWRGSSRPGPGSRFAAAAGPVTPSCAWPLRQDNNSLE